MDMTTLIPSLTVTLGLNAWIEIRQHLPDGANVADAKNLLLDQPDRVFDRLLRPGETLERVGHKIVLQRLHHTLTQNIPVEAVPLSCTAAFKLTQSDDLLVNATAYLMAIGAALVDSTLDIAAFEANRKLFSTPVVAFADSTNPQSSIQFVLVLHSGLKVVARSILPSEYDEISQLTIDRWRQSPNFSRLIPREIAAFVQVNSPEAIKRIVEHAENIAAVIIRDPRDDRVMAYGVVRHGTHRLTGRPVALGKRMHVANYAEKLGLGRQMQQLGEWLAKRCGYDTYVLHATADSQFFFKSLGFRPVPLMTRNTGLLARTGVSVPMVYLEKRIT